MNTDQDTITAKVQAQVRSLGFTDYRRHALKHLRIKTVIKESHCSQVQALEFNRCDDCNGNLFVTVAKDQATVYDDTNMAEHVTVVAALALTNSAEKAKDVFQTCCWINSKGITRHPYGDALLAVAGADSHVLIISIAESAVVAQLPINSSSSVVELSAAADQPGLLLVLCKDGTLQLWQVATGQCYLSIKSDAFTAALHPGGDYIITSNRTGKLSSWDLQQLLPTAAAAAAAAGSDAATAAGVAKEPLALASSQEGSVVDCMRFLAGNRLATKTADGRMAVYSMPSGAFISSWRVPGCSSATASYSSRCSFGHTQDGQYIAVGNHNSTAFVYETSTGLQVARVEAIRIQGSVRACGISEDCRHLLMVVGSGYLFRFESRLTAADSEEEDGGELDSEDVVMRDGSTPPPGLQPDPQAPQQQQQQQQAGQQVRQQGEQQAMDTGRQQQQQQQNQQQLPDSSGLVHNYHPKCSPMMQQGMASVISQGTPGLVLGNTPGAAADSGWNASEGGLGGGWMREGMDVEGCMLGPSTTPGCNVASVGGQQKKPRLEHGRAAEASPLVFRPTPQKQ